MRYMNQSPVSSIGTHAMMMPIPSVNTTTPEFSCLVRRPP